MKTLKNIFLTSIILTFSLNASASVNDEMISLLKKYKWYEDLKSFERNVSKMSLDYHIRLRIAKYLENVGLYDAGNTENCTDTDKLPYHNKKIDTCYTGTPEQNINLLNTLKEAEVKKNLRQVDAYTIINGVNNIFLEDMENKTWTQIQLKWN